MDGEAWIQPPGIVKIVHKNRAQMLTRDRVRTGVFGRACAEEEEGGWRVFHVFNALRFVNASPSARVIDSVFTTIQLLRYFFFSLSLFYSSFYF